MGEHGTARFALAPGLELRVEPDGDGWRAGPHRAGATEPAERAPEQAPEQPPGQDAGQARPAVAGDGAAEALVDLLDVGDPAPRPDGFRLHRISAPPAVRGEHPITVDQTHLSVVVGDPVDGPAVVVKWWRRLADDEHPAPRLLTHLAEVGYAGVPATHGLLLWTAPNGRTLPCAMVSDHLPGAVDGWTWCVEAAEKEIEEGPWGPGFPGKLGRLVAGLHLALTTPSSVLPEPVGRAGAGELAGWHRAAHERLALAAELAAGEALARSGVAEALAERRDAMAAVLDQLLEIDGTAVQPTHADLHVGQLLKWSGGTAVVDFDGNPVVPGSPLQPAARDVAQMLRSLDHVARVADKRMAFTLTSAADAWSERARAAFLAGYRAALFRADREELLDLRLLAAFETEQLCREFVYAARHLPRWAYAPLGGLRQQFPTGDDDAA